MSRRGRPVVAASLALVLSATPGGASASIGGGGGSRPRFSVDSPFIRDAEGRARFFHGVNAVWKLKPYYPPSSVFGTARSKSYFDRRDARFLARTGLNSVRLGVLFVGVEPKHDKFDNSYLRRMEAITKMLAKEGVTVMVDFHQDMYNEKFDGEGFPDWSVHDDGIPPTNCCGFPGNYFTPAVRRTFDNLWDNTADLHDEYRDAWKHVVVRFKDEPNVIGYDLLNEPWPGSQTESCANPQGCPVFDTEKLQPFFEHVMAGIRKVDPTGIIWWDPNVITNSGAMNNVGLLSPIEPNVNQGISFHIYCIAGSPSTGIRPGDDPSCPRSEPFAFSNQHAAAARNDSSLFLTEFGASDDRRDIRRVTRLADQNMVSWHYWHYGEWKDPTTTGTGGAQGLFKDDLKRPETLKQLKAHLLIRTYPQAVAGDPESFRFRPWTNNRRFILTFNADPKISAPTVVFVPVGRHYRGDYEVSVEGPARVVSADDARRLKLKNTGAGEVSVEVVRAD
ncbi:MAG: cellulase family glycosylhydrolase [Actinomycetota bacterium]|nr:cellulase family glycosylhydrolase [Actinomycetota bacterium]